MDKIKLFCFPYAGGSSTAYARWQRLLSKNIELRAIELPGRGTRIEEQLKDSIEEMVDDAYSIIEKELDFPFAFFGHSMGCVIAYELCFRVFEQKGKKPVHAFFSGKKAPHLSEQEESLYNLPEEVFRSKIVNLGGTPVEILKYPELLDFFMPILRSDFKAIESYKFNHGNDDLGCDITILGGKQDNMTFFEISEWNRLTTRNCKIHMFNGGHFFINDNYVDIIRIINYVLTGKTD